MKYAIESVLAQSYPNIEYIVIDGGSNDGTLDVIKQFEDRIPVFVSEPDKGMYDALNKGIRQATGDIVGILHSDDVFAGPHVISSIVSSFESNKDVDAVYADVAFIKNKSDNKIARYYSSKSFTVARFMNGFMPAHPSFFCRRTCFEKYGYYRTDMKIGADFELLLRFFCVAKIKALYLAICTTIMTMGGKSTSGIKSLITINKDFHKALAINKFSSSYFNLYSRYLVKWKEFFGAVKYVNSLSSS